MRSWHQISPQVLAAVAPAFKEPTPPTPEEWRRITAGHSLQLCPTFSCKSCGTVRYVAPIAYDDLTFPLACSQVGLRCNSIRQDFAVTEMQKPAPVATVCNNSAAHGRTGNSPERQILKPCKHPPQRRRSLHSATSWLPSPASPLSIHEELGLLNPSDPKRLSLEGTFHR